MSLQIQLNNDLKTAMLAKDSTKVGVLRMVKAAIANLAIEKKTADLDDQAVLAVIRKNIKTRQDSVEAFNKGNRPLLAKQEEAEITILETYLPQALSDEELDTLVKAAISETGATTKKDMGAVMKLANQKAAGRADGKTLSMKVQSALSAL